MVILTCAVSAMKYRATATMPRKPMALAGIILELKVNTRRKAMLAGKTHGNDYQKCISQLGIMRAHEMYTSYHVKENRHGTLTGA